MKSQRLVLIKFPMRDVHRYLPDYYPSEDCLYENTRLLPTWKQYGLPKDAEIIVAYFDPLHLTYNYKIISDEFKEFKGSGEPPAFFLKGEVAQQLIPWEDWNDIILKGFRNDGTDT